VKCRSALEKARLVGLRSARARGQQIARDRRRFFDAQARLGALYEPVGTVFRVFAPLAREVKVVLADEPAGGAGLASHPMVILDVVYNHTAPSAGFDRLVPGYYFRMRGRGWFANGPGCGNEFRSESPMARKFHPRLAEA